jgi:hypothetical protein
MNKIFPENRCASGMLCSGAQERRSTSSLAEPRRLPWKTRTDGLIIHFYEQTMNKYSFLTEGAFPQSGAWKGAKPGE